LHIPRDAVTKTVRLIRSRGDRQIIKATRKMPLLSKKRNFPCIFSGLFGYGQSGQELPPIG